MDTLYSILNFESNGDVHEINSPRTLEACLRLGFDPAELQPRPLEAFQHKHQAPEMAKIQHDHYAQRRIEKINQVKKERDVVITAMEKLDASSPVRRSLIQPDGFDVKALELRTQEIESTMLEMEKKRLEAVKRRQEREMRMVMEKEAVVAELQQKISNSELEEQKRRKEHEKKVQAQRAIAAKKYTERLKKKAEQDREELAKRKQLTRLEAEQKGKRDAEEAIKAQRRAEQAAEREQARQQKMIDLQRRSEEMIQLQFKKAEVSRKKLSEREARVQAQLEHKKQLKTNEIQAVREAAALRIQAALERNVWIQQEKKIKYDQGQEAAAKRAAEKHQELLVTVKEQADARNRKEVMRERRIEDAYKFRADKRTAIIRHRMERDGQYEKIHEQHSHELYMKKFLTQMRKDDALANVERIKRQEEFNRLQLLRRIESEDERYAKIKCEKKVLLEKRREAMKKTLVRKHLVQETMEQMRITNDYSLIDTLFSTETGRRSKNGTANEDNLAETI